MPTVKILNSYIILYLQSYILDYKYLYHSSIAKFLPSKFQLPSSEFDNAKFANGKKIYKSFELLLNQLL